MTSTFDVRINSLAYGGDALGRLPDGRVVFVPYAIPGEMVRISITEDKPRHARGELVEVLEASPERVIPRCQHFTTCGGCHYQQMNYSSQLKAKADILREQLERIGGLRDLPTVEIMAAPEPWYYRNHHTISPHTGWQIGLPESEFQPNLCHLRMSPARDSH